MTNKEKLIEYMKLKNKLIVEYYNLKEDFIGNEDIKDINNLSDQNIEYIIKNFSNDNDANLCPHCILYIHDYCTNCNFKLRHGRCIDKFSDYSLITGGKWKGFNYELRNKIYSLLTELNIIK